MTESNAAVETVEAPKSEFVLDLDPSKISNWDELQASFKKALENMAALKEKAANAWVEKNGLPPQAKDRIASVVNQYGIGHVREYLDEIVLEWLSDEKFPEDSLERFDAAVAAMRVDSKAKPKCEARLAELRVNFEKARVEREAAEKKAKEEAEKAEKVKKEAEDKLKAEVSEIDGLSDKLLGEESDPLAAVAELTTPAPDKGKKSKK